MNIRAGIMFVLLGFQVLAAAQNGNEKWVGWSTQEGVSGAFYYEIQLSEQAGKLSGTAISRSPDGQHSARFSIAAVWQNGQLMLQEFEQTSPAQPRWCLKMARLQLLTRPDSLVLEGVWTADRCRPGNIRMAIRNDQKERAPLIGQWTGHLSQSDRSYGFFYQMELQADGTGTSYIVSEGSGGSARHQLTWQQDSTGTIQISECEVLEKTDPKWKWCIKNARLLLRREALRWVLEGDWSGMLEGHLTAKGACAPGTVFLEQPILPDTVAIASQEQAEQYKTEQGRQINVNHVLKVARSEIRIQIWDNGVVDGDMATLFLNGKKILGRYKVMKSKYSIPVKLSAENNVLVLHAESLGSVPPNTIAVSVFDGVKEQTIVLCSNLKESGAVLIRTFQIK